MFRSFFLHLTTSTIEQLSMSSDEAHKLLTIRPYELYLIGVQPVIIGDDFDGQIGVRVWGTTGRFDQVKVISD